MNALALACAVLAIGAAAVQPTVLFEEKRIDSGASVQVPFELDGVPDGQQLRLSLKARLDWPGGFAGHNPFLGVQLNGETVTPEHLVNKPIEFTMNDGSDASWWGQGIWRLLYSPAFSEMFEDDPPAYMVADADPYLFVWDITSYIEPGTNTVNLWHPQLLKDPTTVVVADARIEVGDPITPPQVGGDQRDTAGPLPVYVAQEPKPVPIRVRLGAAGTVEVSVGGKGRVLRLTTRTSEPEGQWLSTTGDKWRRLKRGATGKASWEGTGYHISRKVTVGEDHVHVADTITNTSDGLVGTMLEHRLELSDHEAPERLLCGRRVYKEHQTTSSPANPTALATWEDVTVGLVAEDDILRVHSECLSEPESISIADCRLGLGPGASHTLEWSIYLVPGGDYWDFINRVRRNWGSNFAVPGPSLIEPTPDGKKTVAEYREWAEDRCLQFAIAGQQVLDDGHLAEGTAIPLADGWNDRFRVWMDKLHEADPDLKALIYLHSQISTEPEAQTKYADCRVLDAAGKHLVSPYHYPVYLFLPNLDNAYGKALTKTVEFILDDLNADGIYNDCFTYDSSPWAWDLPWDGCTVSIDPTTHAVGKRFSSVVLLQQPWKEQLVDMVRSRGKLIVGNGPLFTHTMLQRQVPTFTETNSFAFLVDTHLSAPWGLGTHNAEQDDPTRAYMARRMLDYGGVYSVYTWLDEPAAPPFICDFFPFTPTELRPGVVMAEERILTNRSGKFGWPDGSRAEVHVYDEQGHLVQEAEVTEVEEDGRRLYEVRLPPRGFAALIRQP